MNKKLVMFTASFAMVFAISASAQSAPYDAPTPALGCRVFTPAGRALKLTEMTDKQLFQVRNCVEIDEAQRAQAQATLVENERRAKLMKESDDELRQIMTAQPGYAGAGPVPYPLPANTPTLILQVQ